MGRRRGTVDVTPDEALEMRRRIAAGEGVTAVGRALGRDRHTVARVLRDVGGLPPRVKPRSPLRLSPREREEISRGLRAGESLRAIARTLGRSPSTVAREVAANGHRLRYRAWRGEARAIRMARRPRPAKLARKPLLRRRVEALLRKRWSPQQIAARLRHDHPADPEMWVSHETIYQSLYVAGRGALRRELLAYLRSGRPRRLPRRPYPAGPVGQLMDMTLIRDRPPEVEDRAVPGHWEGDLLVGRNNKSAIATLVERRTRYVLLVALPGGRSAPAVRAALQARIVSLPDQLRRTLTWDRGKEMAEHVQFTVATGIQVYFCDPHSPWQRGSNENTNGLLRQYFPRGTDLSVHDQAHLDAVARELNDRPRQTLGWLKPCEVLAQALR